MKLMKELKKQLRADKPEDKESFGKLRNRIDAVLLFEKLVNEDIQNGRIKSFDDISCEEYLEKIKAAGYEVSDPAALLRDMRDRVNEIKRNLQGNGKLNYY